MIQVRNAVGFVRLVCLCCVAGAPALGAFAAPQATEVADALPRGAPGDVAQLFHSALDLPDVAEWIDQDRKALLEVVTLRYGNRLMDRAPAASRQRAERYVEHLAQSPLAREFPNALRQTCAQYGLMAASCAPHRGFVRRALVLEEMLAQGLLTLERMETELAGAPRPTLADWRQGTDTE